MRRNPRMQSSAIDRRDFILYNAVILENQVKGRRTRKASGRSFCVCRLDMTEERDYE